MKRGSSTMLRNLALAAGGLIVVGVVGTAFQRMTQRTNAHSKITIRRPRQEVWNAWAPLVDLPRFLRFVEEVEDLGNGRSRWTARVPNDGGATFEWIAQEVERVPGERIRWKTIEGTPLHEAGEVRFWDAGNGRGTVVRLDLTFSPNASPLQAAAARTPIPKAVVKDELNRFKTFLETGEVYPYA